MECKIKIVKQISDARKEIALKLEETLGQGGSFKLYPRKLDKNFIDVIVKDAEILTIANENFKQLYNKVDFERAYESKGDKYKDRFKRTYDTCHAAIKSNGNVSLNTTVIGVIGPLFDPERFSNGYNVHNELAFSIKELQDENPEYFGSLSDYKYEYISINDLAKLMFNIQDSDVNAEDDGELDEIDRASEDMEQLTYSRNKILFGPPGVGKSYSIKTKLNLINVKEENITRITFHPEYSYYEFVGQYKPVVAYEKIVGEIRYPSSSVTTNEKAFVYYDFVPGPFTKAIINALKLGEVDNQKAPENALLIIEEINRGNSTAIFGDVFQLLDRINNVNSQYYGESEYSIDISAEMKEHIKKELGWEEEDWNKRFKRGFVIPSNLYIYSTMNTSDQSLYPMDSAFKRRWDMEYIYINYDEDKLSDLYLPEPYKDIKWLDFIKSSNKEIVNYTGVDDKQIGQWFVGNSLSKSEFLGKVISYLWFDVFRYDPQVIFKEEIKTFDDIRSLYSKGIFNNEFINSIKIAEDNIDDGGEGYERD